MPSWAGSRRESAEGRAFLQRRLAFFGKVGFFISFGFYLAVHAASALRPDYSWRVWVGGDGLLHLGTAAVLGLVWLICRRGRLTARALAAVDAGGSTLACLGASLPVLLPEATADYKYRMLLVITNALIARAAVVPTPPAWTLGVSATAALPAVVLTFLFHAGGGRAGGTRGVIFQTLLSLLWVSSAIAICTITSHIIYGLRQQVREAQQLGQYTLEEKVGEGGMGEVYRARHALLRRPTAVKLLPPGRGADSLLRFEREVQLTSILTHPNTVAVFDYGHTPDGVFYYAMEYLEGVTLDDLVSLDGPQPPARVVHVLTQVCGSLAEAHGIGLIHRDVKPANIILCERGGVPDVAKVLDFGLVKALESEVEAKVTRDQVITGTPYFLSPEALTTPQRVDARSDLYSLGGVAYYLLSGHHVFEGASLVEVCAQHLHAQPAPPSERLGAALPADLEAVVLACLEKDPGRRPPSARALADRLAACAGVGVWGEADARAWWTARGQRLASTRKASNITLTQAITIDLSDRSSLAGREPPA